jgi:hypothetical protein
MPHPDPQEHARRPHPNPHPRTPMSRMTTETLALPAEEWFARLDRKIDARAATVARDLEGERPPDEWWTVADVADLLELSTAGAVGWLVARRVPVVTDGRGVELVRAVDVGRALDRKGLDGRERAQRGQLRRHPNGQWYLPTREGGRRRNVYFGNDALAAHQRFAARKLRDTV